MTVAETDVKAGFSSYCRSDYHDTCAALAARCACACHGRRRAKERASMPNRPTPLASVPTLAEGQGWEDPPTARRGGPIDYAALAKPCLTSPGRWLRIKTYKAKTSAGSARNRCKKVLGDGWEVRSAHIPGGSALYVRKLP